MTTELMEWYSLCSIDPVQLGMVQTLYCADPSPFLRYRLCTVQTLYHS